MISRSVVSVSLVVLFFALQFNACNSRPGNKKDRVVPDAPLPAILLDSLSITGAGFMAKLDTTRKQNIIFNYFLADSAVTLHGWVLKKGRSGSGTTQSDTGIFSPVYDLKLTPVGKSKIAIGPNTYLSNQVILGKTEKKILRIIQGKNSILYFSPMKDATGRISYRIRIKLLSIDSSLAVLQMFETNPAPPHQAFD